MSASIARREGCLSPDSPMFEAKPRKSWVSASPLSTAWLSAAWSSRHARPGAPCSAGRNWKSLSGSPLRSLVHPRNFGCWRGAAGVSDLRKQRSRERPGAATCFASSRAWALLAHSWVKRKFVAWPIPSSATLKNCPSARGSKLHPSLSAH